MKDLIVVSAIVLSLVSATPALARGENYARHGGDYYGRSSHFAHNGGRRHNNGLAIVAGAVGGLILGSALLSAAAPPPPTVVYGYPNVSYGQQAVVEQPRICVEEQRVDGEWQVSRYNGQQVWVSFSHPVTRSVQVPCY